MLRTEWCDVRVRHWVLLQELAPSLLVFRPGYKPRPIPLLPTPCTRSPPPIQLLVTSTEDGEDGGVGTHATYVNRQPLCEVGNERCASSHINILQESSPVNQAYIVVAMSIYALLAWMIPAYGAVLVAQ